MSDVMDSLGLIKRPGRSRNLSHELADSLSQKIRSCILRPGEQLPTESAIIREFGVSRTVVREALSSLQASGLVETRHGVGTFVRATPNGLDTGLDPETIVTLRDVASMLELRVSLETEAAGLAAARRTDAQLEEMRRSLAAFQQSMDGQADGADADFQFHLQVAYATRNRYFAEVMGHLGTATIPRSRIHSVPANARGAGEYLKHLNQQHAGIYGAIYRRDPETARALMRAHLSASYDRLRRAAEAAESGSRQPGRDGVSP